LKRLNRDRSDVVIAYPTVLEAYTLVLYRLGDHIASNWLNDILAGAALINPTPDDYREAANKILAFTDQPITLFDATVAVLAARLEIEVWTYDHHFDVMRTAVWR
jgi:predicted nucleic acid-binding protein